MALDLPDRLEDGVVALRRLTEADVDAVVKAFRDEPSLHVTLGMPVAPTAASTRAGIAEEAAGRAAGTWVRWAIARARDDAFAGSLILRDIDPRHRRCELGIWTTGEARRQGAGLRALALAERVVFGHWGYERIWLRTAADNRAMRGLAKKAGFREEGVLRAHERENDGSRTDMVVFGLLAGDRM
jgi:[ribosomal protein S5]-alanine N-acetyltransferase